jgi:ABC-type glycerol-3-phosphate transport system substrate-binding protein
MSDNSVSIVGLDMAAVRNGDLSHFIYEADLEKNTLTAYAKRGENMWLCAPGNSDFDYFYSDYECAGAVLFPREELKLIDWAAYGIANCVSSFAVLPENALICAARRDADFGAYNTAELSALFTGNSVAELLVFTPKAGTPEAAETPRNQDRTVLKLVSFGPFRYTDLLENFNVENSDYEIVLSEYDAAINPATFELDTDTILKFNTEIITGNIPDILMYPGSVSMNDYISKELLENLYNFIDSDLEINRGAFVPAILNSYEKDKALYRLPIGFNIATVAALKTTLDGKTAWTLNDLITLERQTGKASLPNKTSAQVLEFMLRQNLDNFINLESGICNFNGAEFIEILEYAKSFPAEIRERNPASGSTQVREGAALADTIYVSEYFSYIEHKRAYGDIKYIGYPADGGDRGMFGTFDTVSIFSKSKEKSAVWDFVRMFFSEKYQLNNPNTAWPLFPVNQAALNKTANFALEKEMTQEEIGEVNELIASVNTAAQLDYAPFRIIKEEAAPYFAGQKTAKEAADIIQSRMSIYAAERR